MPWEFRATRRVEFHETDMAGIVHFSNFFRYIETVEGEFYRSLGHSVLLRNNNPPLGLPRVHASCDYLRPLKFEDVFEMHLLVREKKEKSVSYEIRFRRVSPDPGELLAVAKIVAVCVFKDATGKMQSTAFPPSLAEKLEVAPEGT
ncbi:MAG TPA: thioesterase family protein [Candidatus Limnocylindria bacterium]|nr:thioesterase family protein [Candidatus Limnocylindria bacterium]